MSRSLRTDPRPRQALRRAPGLDRVRIHVHAPRPGFAHPASGRDVREVLYVVGPWAWYGLRSVELRQTEDFHPGLLVYGRTRTPGEIFLYEQRTATTSRDFMRFDVLLHELGHHVLQHRARKVGAVQRTSDHERFAETFAARWKPIAQAALS
ncbi:ImmA/IrrE family metallo-endopeptidase [Dactylosporangium cerinum]|uniref:ImmA/IrrE family metallo-endopeptidase n=1 Tax=Dactylosporangium cerinum TaxID=1434730 RepID=A0ABV9VYH1_9ACTN